MTYKHNAAWRVAFFDLMKRSIEGLPNLGDILTWDMQGIQVKHRDLCLALEEHNLGYYLPSEPGEAKALERAINGWLDARQQNGLKLFSSGSEGMRTLVSNESKRFRCLLRPLTGNKSEHSNVGFPLVLEESDPLHLELRYDTQLRVAVRAGGTLLVTQSPRGGFEGAGARPDLAAELGPYWSDYHQLQTSQDLAVLVCRIVKDMDATSIRGCGGAYYVPSFWRHGVARLESLAITLRQQSKSTAREDTDDNPLHVLGIMDSKSARASLAGTCKRLQNDIASMTRDMADLTRIHTARYVFRPYKID